MTISSTKAFVAAAVVAVVFLLGLGIWIMARGQDTMTLHVNDKSVVLLVADSPLEQYRGLSGKTVDGLAPAQGMVFVFSQPKVQNFVMRGMLFDLDFVFISEGKVIDVQTQVKAPQAGETPQTVTSDPLEADTVIELPAGQATKLDLLPGRPVTLTKD